MAEFWVNVGIPAATELRLTAVPRVVLDGGVPEQPGDQPLGADDPDVLGWLSEDGEYLSHGPDLDVREPGDRQLRVLVHQPPDAAVTVQIRTSEPT